MRKVSDTAPQFWCGFALRDPYIRLGRVGAAGCVPSREREDGAPGSKTSLAWGEPCCRGLGGGGSPGNAGNTSRGEDCDDAHGEPAAAGSDRVLWSRVAAWALEVVATSGARGCCDGQAASEELTHSVVAKRQIDDLTVALVQARAHLTELHTAYKVVEGYRTRRRIPTPHGLLQRLSRSGYSDP